MRASRGYVYSICASSTCSLASYVWARVAKMSRISSDRSITLIPSPYGRPASSLMIFSRLPICDGDKSLSKMTTSASSLMARRAISSALPLPM